MQNNKWKMKLLFPLYTQNLKATGSPVSLHVWDQRQNSQFVLKENWRPLNDPKEEEDTIEVRHGAKQLLNNYNWNCRPHLHCMITLLRSIFIQQQHDFYIHVNQPLSSIKNSSIFLMGLISKTKAQKQVCAISTIRFFFIQIDCWNQNTKGIYRRDLPLDPFHVLGFIGVWWSKKLLNFTTLAPKIYKLLTPQGYCPRSLDGSGKLALGNEDGIWII